MNKQELIEKINKTKEHLANMEKMLEEFDSSHHSTTIQKLSEFEAKD